MRIDDTHTTLLFTNPTKRLKYTPPRAADVIYGLAVTRRRWVLDEVVLAVDSQHPATLKSYENSFGTFCLAPLLAIRRDNAKATSTRAIATDNPKGILTSFLAAPMLLYPRIAKPD